MMHRTAALVASQEALGSVDVDYAAANIAGRGITYQRPFAGNLLKTEHVSEDRRGFVRALQQQCHAMEAADRMLRGDVPVAPPQLVLGAGNADERKRHS